MGRTLELARGSPSTYFRINRLAAWMACSNLGESRVSLMQSTSRYSPSLATSIGSPVHKTWGQGPRTVERGSRKNVSHLGTCILGKGKLRGSLGL